MSSFELDTFYVGIEILLNKMKKKITTILSFLLLASSIVWLIVEGTKLETLPIGSKLPGINYKTINVNATIKPDNERKILIMFFSKDCPHCKFELNVLDKNVTKIIDTKLYLFTTDKNYLLSKDINEYEVLKENVNVTFGIVNKEEYSAKFGSTVTPTLYFFNKAGKLTAKIKGETKIERILKELRVSDGAQHRDSGTNKSSSAVGHY